MTTLVTWRVWPIVLAIAVTLAMASGAMAVERIVRVEVSPVAPAGEVASLQAQSDAWLPSFYQAFPEALRSQVTMVSIERLPRGIGVRLEVDASSADAARATAASELKQLLAGAHLRYAYRLSGDGFDQQAPRLPEGSLRAIVMGAGGLLVLLLGLILLVRRRQLLALPTVLGVPIIGILPAGLGMGGRFLELQSPPAQALGVFFRGLATKKRPMIREAAVLSLDDQEASAVVTACLSIALLRERGRVLVIDLAGEESLLPAILEETDDAGELPGQGMLRATSIADLDLLTGLVPVSNQRPPLPSDLLGRYRWILYHAPMGVPLERTRHILVLAGGGALQNLWRARWQLAWHRAGLLGTALVGVEVAARMRDGFMARFYFEKLQAQEASV